MVSQRQGVNDVCLILYENGPEEHWHDQPPKASAVPDNVREPSSSVDVSVRQQGTHVNHLFSSISSLAKVLEKNILTCDSVCLVEMCVVPPSCH